MTAVEFFKTKCIEKGIKGVNQHTSFRWDEVVEFMIDFSDYQPKDCNKLRIENIEKLREIYPYDIGHIREIFDKGVSFSENKTK